MLACYLKHFFLKLFQKFFTERNFLVVKIDLHMSDMTHITMHIIIQFITSVQNAV